jgi:PDZ domain-containing protein
MSYGYASGEDLVVGRAVAGTGKISGDGEVGSIGGLLAKATAARRVGADLLLLPAGQRATLNGFEPQPMQLSPVASLDEAIDALSRGAICSR